MALSRPAGRTEFLEVSGAIGNAESAVQDGEHARIDDDKNQGPNDNLNLDQRGMSVPARRLTGHQGRRPRLDRVDRTRNSSTSSSTSEPNSVEAFADPRRRERANTLESKAPSFIELKPPRSLSNATALPRSTVTDPSITRHEIQVLDSPPEDDVTFPTYEEPGKTFKIDYEELDEFVALSAPAISPSLAPGEGKPGASKNDSRPHIFHDLRHGHRKLELPVAIKNSEFLLQTPSEEFFDDKRPGGNHKAGDEKILEVPPPGKKERFCLFSSETQSALHATGFGDFVSDGKTTFRDLFELGPDGGVWWLDVQNPTDGELEVIRKAFGIHPLTKEDIHQQEAREKVELFQQYYFVCFRSFFHDKRSEDFLEPVNIYIVVCREGVLSFSFTESPHAKNVRKRISRLRDFVDLGSDYICYAMMWVSSSLPA